MFVVTSDSVVMELDDALVHECALLRTIDPTEANLFPIRNFDSDSVQAVVEYHRTGELGTVRMVVLEACDFLGYATMLEAGKRRMVEQMMNGLKPTPHD
jgi:hypothetical protein